MTTVARLTLDEFLDLPETEPPSEFICGEVVEKPMPSPYHSLIASALSAMFFAYLRSTREGVVMSEGRHTSRRESRAYLPDIGVMRMARFPTDPEVLARGPIETAPDIAIEVLSPDDRPGRVAEKLAFYLRSGSLLVWFVDPVERTVVVHRPGQPSTFHQPPEVIDAAPVLGDFRLDLAELFAVLDPQGPDGPNQ